MKREGLMAMKTKDVLYKKIIDYVHEEIRSGRLVPHQKMPTEMELMEQFGVSRVTVIKALSELTNRDVIYRVQGKGSFVNDFQETKKRDLRVISLIVPFHDHALKRFDETEMIRGIEKYLRDTSYFLTIHFTEQNSDLEKQTIRKCLNEGVDGIILYPSVDSDNVALLSELMLEQYPIVILDNLLYGLPLTCVQTNNKKGGQLATQHLIERGFDPIYFISDHKIQLVSTRDRYFGYCTAIKDAKRAIFDGSYIVLDKYEGQASGQLHITYEENKALFQNILRDFCAKHPNQRVGIFAAHDGIALSFLQAASELGIQVPERLGIIGFDDIEEGARAAVPLSTVKQNFFEIGRTSAETVVNLIQQKPDASANAVVDVDVELIVRQTT